MNALILIIAGVFGLIAGSFLNVCIYRIPLNKSVVWPGSSCPKCEKKIAWYDNIPVFSFLFLAGKCRNCKTKISWQYPVVEFITAALTVLLVWRYGLSPWTFVALAAVYALIILSVIDIHTFEIPDRFSLGLIVAGLAFCWLNPYFSGVWWQKLLQSFGGACAGFFGLWAVALIGQFIFKKEAMGFGDVKLMGGVGAFLGWGCVITTMFMACLLGCVYALYLTVFKKAGKGAIIPFGPFISAGMLINLFYYITPSMMLIQV